MNKTWIVLILLCLDLHLVCGFGIFWRSLKFLLTRLVCFYTLYESWYHLLRGWCVLDLGRRFFTSFIWLIFFTNSIWLIFLYGLFVSVWWLIYCSKSRHQVRFFLNFHLFLLLFHLWSIWFFWYIRVILNLFIIWLSKRWLLLIALTHFFIITIFQRWQSLLIFIFKTIINSLTKNRHMNSSF